MRTARRIAAAVFAVAALALTFNGGAGAAPAQPAIPGKPVPPRPAEFSAQADAYPCSGQVGYREGRPIYNCPLWGGNDLPVYANTSDPRFGGNEVIGYISSYNTNWFWCQTNGGWYGSMYGYNTHWANTKADNLRNGYLPVYYFKGGGDDEPDGSLRWC